MVESTTAQPGSPAPNAPTSPVASASNGSFPPAAGSGTQNTESIQAEDERPPGASLIDDEQLSSYTVSLASSAIDYPTEYGRRYHAFRAGSYVLPNDEHEMDRLDYTHAVTARVIGNRLYLAPLDKNKVTSILDIGTGTGIWAMEMGDIFPNAEVIGYDLSAIQPQWVPPNVKFEMDDVESAWVDYKKYDYIFCRFMAACIADWPKLVRNIYDHLNPGGYAEFQDASIEYYSEDGTLTEEHSFRKWNKTLVDALKSIGRDPSPGPKLKGWVRDTGFQDVTHSKFKIPLAPWPKNKFYKDIGAMNLRQFLDGLEGFTMRVFCGVLGHTEVEAQVWLASVRKELKTLHSFHSQFDFQVVYGRKPEEISE
ncbi:Secondary metabolism regulator LAE1 [Colletotrichum trifolii]|uniref:Secondary metabolism regulator LAE1 n=1 Tax=Colletotrichum trifolii TaxID=5466 RepID=A0A4R8QSE3_COLTR|nr:Secondary metabolism regulator LAE1 [Colletotrichum trifolii]